MTKEEYLDYLLTDRWKRKAKAAKRKTGNRCQVCNGTDRLQVHHRSYDRIGREKPADLTVLCEACHKRYHADLPRYSEYLLTRKIHGIVDLVFGILRQHVARISG